MAGQEESDEEFDSWLTRELQKLGGPPPGFDEEAAMARFYAGVQRMETDPEYAAHIRRITDEVDADLAAEKKERADD